MKYPENGWSSFFNEVRQKDYYKVLEKFIIDAYRNGVVFPNMDDIFNAFNFTSLENVKVVIFGQDPYHEINQAMGLAFGVKDYVKTPPSLINIYKEIENEFNVFMNYENGDLTYLAKQGVLLLNAILTVEEGKPLSHDIKEYDLFFKDVISELNKAKQPIVFLLFGNKAKKYQKYILENDRHFVLCTNHPSPLSANRGGWFNSGIFKRTNELLLQNGLDEINWCNTLISY